MVNPVKAGHLIDLNLTPIINKTWNLQAQGTGMKPEQPPPAAPSSLSWEQWWSARGRRENGLNPLSPLPLPPAD